jgi:hypothetical protein
MHKKFKIVIAVNNTLHLNQIYQGKTWMDETMIKQNW